MLAITDLVRYDKTIKWSTSVQFRRIGLQQFLAFLTTFVISALYWIFVDDANLFDSNKDIYIVKILYNVNWELGNLNDWFIPGFK